MIREMLNKVIQRQNLTESEMMSVMNAIADGQITPAQIGALLAALRMKGETVDELTGAARVMRSRCTVIPVQAQPHLLVDTCGTGGDGVGTFNVSTTTAFVLAGAGLKVAKHGNRAVSSRCGSADVLEALGVNLELTPEQIGTCIDQVGIGFLFAPRLHGAMGHVVGPRREMGLRTIFNLLGPLTNPAGAGIQVLGVCHPDLTETMAQVLLRLGSQGACVVHGLDGCDEVSICAPSRISQLYRGWMKSFTLTPEEFGLKRARIEDIQGGDAAGNAHITMEVLEGSLGPTRDIVLLNAAVALLAAERVNHVAEGLAIAAQAIDSGRALNCLLDLVNLSRSMAGLMKAAV